MEGGTILDKILDFLSLVWGDRMGWVDIPSKSGGHWIPFSASWPEDKPLIRRRLESCLEDQEDVYFSVAQFGEEGRRIKDTLGSAWLWADLDRVGPDDCAVLDLTPSVCWESSPWRYQALWRLDRRLKPAALSELNRALTYAIGGDRGGWDLTQVLRPVGTRNFKYPGGPEVLEVYRDGPEYSAKVLYRRLKDHVQPRHAPRMGASVQGRGDSKIPARARALLATPAERVVVGERSGKLWELECLLAEAGLEEDQIVELVAPSAWNKWPRSERRLRDDVQKAIDHVARKSPPVGRAGGVVSGGNGGKTKGEAEKALVEKVVRTDEAEFDDLDLSVASEEAAERRIDLPFVKYSGFMAQNLEAPRWLVQDLWMAQSHGIIGGEAKSSKSLLAMAMGLSIASGEPFLGLERFNVSSPGPVLMIQEENSPWDVQDKLRKLARLYRLIKGRDIERTPAEEGSVAGQIVRLSFPTDAPLMLLNNFGFDMSQEENREALEEAIQREGAVLLVLDPLYLMLGGEDADKSWNVLPFQRWLLSLRYTYGCAVALVHHFGKPRMENKGVRQGHRLLGSGTWYNWVDSAVYCEALDPVGWFDEEKRGLKVNRRLQVEREWRSAPPQEALELRMHMGGPGSLRMIVETREMVSGGKAYSRQVGERIETYVSERGEKGALLREISRALDIDRRTVRKHCVGTGKYKVSGVPRGRGQSFRVWLAGAEK
jgi:hypothetical protein